MHCMNYKFTLFFMRGGRGGGGGWGGGGGGVGKDSRQGGVGVG